MANLTFTAKVNKIWRIQKHRYQLKGTKNTGLGIVFLFILFWAGWAAGKALWPEETSNRTTFMAWSLFTIHTLFQVIGALYYLPGYFKWSWFSWYEKFRVNKKSLWPWQRANWKEMKSKTVKNLLINQLLIFPIPCYFSTFIGR